MEDFKYQLVLQLPGTEPQDFDELVELEEAIADALENTPHDLDGHDFGSGTGNIFIHTDAPAAAFAVVQEAVRLTDYPELRVAYRAFEENDYHLLWPDNSAETFNLI